MEAMRVVQEAAIVVRPVTMDIPARGSGAMDQALDPAFPAWMRPVFRRCRPCTAAGSPRLAAKATMPF